MTSPTRTLVDQQQLENTWATAAQRKYSVGVHKVNRISSCLVGFGGGHMRREQHSATKHCQKQNCHLGNVLSWRMSKSPQHSRWCSTRSARCRSCRRYLAVFAGPPPCTGPPRGGPSSTDQGLTVLLPLPWPKRLLFELLVVPGVSPAAEAAAAAAPVEETPRPASSPPPIPAAAAAPKDSRREEELTRGSRAPSRISE